MDEYFMQSISQRVGSIVVNKTETVDCLRESCAIPAEAKNTLISLERRCMSISRAMLILLDSGESSEAQVFERTLIEASCKFLFIMRSGRDAGNRIMQYNRFLPVFQAAGDNEKLSKYYEKYQDTLKDTLPLSLLDVDIDAAAQAGQQLRSNKKARKLEAEWNTFNVISRGFPDQDYVPALLLRYSMSCHMSHANSIGLQLFDFDPIGKHVFVEKSRMALMYYQLHWILAFSTFRYFYAKAASQTFPPEFVWRDDEEKLLHEIQNETKADSPLWKLYNKFEFRPIT